MPTNLSQNSTGIAERLREGLGWRAHLLRQRVASMFGVQNVQWARVEMNRAAATFVNSLNFSQFRVAEISGHSWKNFGFREHIAPNYPAFDVCTRPLEVAGFDMVIAEQVLEHVLWPYRAVRHIHEMLKPGGWFLVSTPFLLPVHNFPVDCSRWTELGLKHLLAEGGFDIERIQTGSWGNRACVKSNLTSWTSWIPWLHSLKNEPNYPVVVWAFAQR